MKRLIPLLLFASFGYVNSYAQNVTIDIDTESDNIEISPYTYGRNGTPKDTEIQLIKEAGIKFERMNDGNNCTKYNWRKKITCHPDWYNNVYDCDWDSRAINFQQEFPYAKGMFAFQLIGKAAANKDHNFNDWEYNKSKGWSGTTKKMCGGGLFDNAGNVIQLGDTSLFLQDWPADSTVGIYKHWEEDLNLDMNQFEYWNMDNEMEIWGGTHSDVMPATYTDNTYEEIMQKYFAVAKAIRKINPNVKLCGPAAASEWTWFNGCGNTQPKVNGKTYCWLEYFIMRCAQEEKATGVRMIDVLDLHNYPEVKTDYDMLQTHRMFYDRDFIYAGANGVKRINGSWNENIKSEYIFERCKEWIIQYFGSDNGIKFGVGEYNIKNTASQMVQALAYASCIGEGSRHGMEYFTPWTWYNSMWEVVHLFSTNAKKINVGAISSNESMVSAYSSKNITGDSINIIFVNRDTEAKNVTTRIINSTIDDGTFDVLTLQNLPETQTFQSHTDNALKSSTVKLVNNSLEMALPPYSITSVTLHGGTVGSEEATEAKSAIYPNPASTNVYVASKYTIEKIELINSLGITCRTVECNSSRANIPVSDLNPGVYVMRISSNAGAETSLISIK